MRLEYRRKNGYDTVLLIDGTTVLSDWPVNHMFVMKDFCDCSQNAEDWDNTG